MLSRLKLIFLTLLLSLNILFAQNQRFLEKRDFKEGKINNGHVQFLVSTNANTSKLAVGAIYIEMNTPAGKMKSITSSMLLNLANGRVEEYFNGQNLYYLGDDLLLYDEREKNGQWQKMTDFKVGKSYIFNPVTDERKEIVLPDGFVTVGQEGKFVWAANFPSQKTLVLENKNSELNTIREFDLTSLKISSDGKQVYGKTFMNPAIQVYELGSGKLVKSVKSASAIHFQMLKNGNFITSSMSTAHLVNDDGAPLTLYADSGPFFTLNDSETEMITVNDRGSIKLWDVASGRIIVEVTDTYIGKKNSSKRTGIPYKISGGKFYLIPYSNGIISVFSARERAIIANLFFDESDWAVIAKDGRIDGTQGAFEKLEWREYEGSKLLRTASLESSFEKYYTPRLLYTLLEGDESMVSQTSAPAMNTLKNDMAQMPKLELVDVNNKAVSKGEDDIFVYNSKQKNITVKLKVTDNKDLIKEVRLYHNGKLIAIQPKTNTDNYTFNCSLNSLFGEVNSIYAIASTEGGLDSEKCKLSVSYREKTDAKPKLYIMIVGINKYQNPRYELNYALTDATSIKNQLNQAGSNLFESINTLTFFEDQAIKGNLINAFKELSEKVEEQDMFIFYYAGHGTMGETPSNEFYIVPHDVTQLYGNEGLLKEKAISASEMKTLSMSINAQKQVFIIDACHSASALNSAVTRGAAEEKAIGQLARSTGTFWLTASGSDQFATELGQLGHGVFTYSLLEALEGKVDHIKTDGLLTVRELSSYLEQRVPELSAKYKGSPQYPASFSFGNDFPIWIFNSK